MIFVIVEFLRGWLMPYPFWIRNVGRRGEYLARRTFHRRGYHLVAHNWRHGHGEMDLIMANWRHLVFVEVKTRRYRENLRIGDQVRYSQKKRLMSLARVFLKQWRDQQIPWEFQVVLVTFQVDKPWHFSVQHATLE